MANRASRLCDAARCWLSVGDAEPNLPAECSSPPGSAQRSRASCSILVGAVQTAGLPLVPPYLPTMSKIQSVVKTDQEGKIAKPDLPAETPNDDKLKKAGKGKSAGDKLPKVKPTDTE